MIMNVNNTLKFIRTCLKPFPVTMLFVVSLAFSPLTGKASDESGQTITTSETDEQLTNLGWYLGYDLSKAPNPPLSPVILPDDEVTATIQTQYGTSVGLIYALPFMVSSSDPLSTIIPFASGNNETGSTIATNYPIPYNIFTLMPVDGYSLWSNYDTYSETEISVAPLVDEAKASDSTYFSTMTSQAIYNLLTTPDYTFCTSDHTNGTFIQNDCDYLHNYLVTNNILEGGATKNDDGSVTYGKNLPSVTKFISGNYTESLVPSLNVDTLMAPLIYNTEASEDSEEDDEETGYMPNTQAKQAAAFIRYLSGQNLMGTLPKYDDYNKLITNISADDAETRNNAVSSLYTYFMNLRTLAANVSVGVSNLSAIMAKRMKNEATGTSQAFDEYSMATRRVLIPTETDNLSDLQAGGNQWIASMQTASPAVVQKEMLFLLAEINYQLYLSRVQDERILLTLSTIQLQGANSARSAATLEDTGEDTGE